MILFQDLVIGLFAQIGPTDFGSALRTVVGVAGLAVFGGYTFSFAAHAFAVIAEGTAAGQDEVAWPNDPLVDRIGKAAIMGWVFLVSASVPFIIGKIIAGVGIGTWIFTLTGFGLVFPIVVLSIQSSNSLFGIINSGLLARIAKRPEHLACYYLAIAPVLAVMGFSLWLAFRYDWWVLIGASVLFAAGLLIASRLIGRLGLLVGRIGLKRRAKLEETEDGPFDLGAVADIAAGRKARSAKQTHESYGMHGSEGVEPSSASPTPSLKRIWVEEGSDDPYELREASPTPELPKEFAQPSEYEMKLAMRNQRPPIPKHPWLQNTYTFPFQPANWPALIWLTVGLTMAGIFARVIVNS